MRGPRLCGNPDVVPATHPTLRNAMESTPLKRRGLLGLIAALPIFARRAEAGPPSFELEPGLVAGQHWRYAFERKVQRGGQVMHWYRATLRLRVLESGADGTLLEWIEGDQVIVEAHPSRRPVMEMGFEIARDLPIVVALDAAGGVRSLANLDVVRTHCLALMDALAARWRDRPDTAALADNLLPAMKAAYATDAMVAAATLKEPMLLLGAMGRRFGADEPVEFRTALANPLGGEPLPAIARFAIRDVRPGEHQAELGWLMVSDPVATDSMAREGAATAANVVAAAVGPDKARLAADAAALPAITLEERGDYVVDTATAWPVRVTHARTLRAGALVQVEETWFTRA